MPPQLAAGSLTAFSRTGQTTPDSPDTRWTLTCSSRFWRTDGRAALIYVRSPADSSATTHRATRAYVGTQDRGGLAHRPAPWPELIRKRSLVQVQVAPPAISPGQRTWALLCRHRYALYVPHPCQMGADWRPVRAPLTRLACRLCPRAHAVVRWWREGRSTLRGGCCGPCAPSIPAGSHRLGR